MSEPTEGTKPDCVHHKVINRCASFCDRLLRVFRKMWDGKLDPDCEACSDYKRRERE
jgi:hypothetical protein